MPAPSTWFLPFAVNFARRVALAFVALAGGLASGTQASEPERFHDVKGWRGRLVATARPSPMAMQLIEFTLKARGVQFTFDYQIRFTADFLLDEYDSEPSVWTGRMLGAHYDSGYQFVAATKDGVQQSVFDTSGRTVYDAADAPRLEFHRARGWSVRLPSSHVPTALREQFRTKDGKVMNSDSNGRAHALARTETHPYPARGLVLAGRGTREASFPGVSGLWGPTPAVSWEYTIDLEPTALDELKLEIEEPAGYARWRPKTTAAAEAGEPLTVTARVVAAAGGQPKTRVEKFEWRLADTSREPGVAMNFPVGAQDTRFDLELDATGLHFSLSEEKQKLERAVRDGFSDTVKVVPFDWGGWSTLEVTAILADGRRLTGKVKGRDEVGLRVPKRAAGSRIADGWKEKPGARGSDHSDEDRAPVGDGTKGDGFTLYQEYRGFYHAGEHLEGDPGKKELFIRVRNAGIAIAGIQKFARLTQLAVHYQLQQAEMPASRVMNANRARGPHVADQHGVIVQVNPALKGLARAVGGPGNPGTITSVDLMSDAAARDPGWLKSTVAHELGHCVNLWHHGEADDEVVWHVDQGVLRERGAGGGGAGVPISVMDENGSDQTALWVGIVSGADGGVLQLWRGRDQGQHSGHDNCIMRYDCAEIYAHRRKPDWRVALFDEPIGHALCASPQGVGVNRPGRSTPIDRYGAAASGRGNCTHQILVNDAMSAPKR